MITWRTGDGVRLQARSGRDVTAVWGDLALAGLHLPAGTVLDGEAVITTEDGRISFEAPRPEPPPPPPAPAAWPSSVPRTTSPSTPCNSRRDRGHTSTAVQRAPRSPPQPPGRTARAHPDPGRRRHRGETC
ncbi:DNA ligase-like domain-containing protein [Streptomyces mirabilis]|uniref:hypothetical protein n=1 Tax=Streptomyces mirabilis TaxID=68239 RepID=UPI003426DCF5